MKTKHEPQVKIYSNTDNIDINEKCIGLDVSITDDRTKNRGLHIQIRHSGDKNTYDFANELQTHIVKCVNMHDELVEALEQLLYGQSYEVRDKLEPLLKKAKGE